MSRKKTRIAVFMGGVSLEHEVSLRSGQGVMQALTASGYDVTGVTLLKDGRWRFPDVEPLSPAEALGHLMRLSPDCVFIALHGPNGEDGRIQGLFDCIGLPYTGSGCAASALAIDKVRAKAVATTAGIRTAPHFIVSHQMWKNDHTAIAHQVMDKMGLPTVIKAPSQGSSCGMAIPQNEHDFVRDMNEVITLEDVAMIEAYVQGLEVTCSVLDTFETHGCRALPVTEIRPNTSAFFDYYSKYTPGASAEITPARIGAHLAHAVQEAAVNTHNALGCTGWSRSDFIIDDNGPVWLETNTVPGLTETSLFPQAAAVEGISYNELIALLVEDGIQRWHYRRQKD